MRDAGLVEDSSHGSESFLQIEAFGSELCVQDRFAESARTRLIDQEAQDLRADAIVALLQQYSHAPDFHFARAMLDHPAASDGESVQNGKCVKCVRVVRVHFDFL